jgi:hypothetical protein
MLLNSKHFKFLLLFYSGNIKSVLLHTNNYGLGSITVNKHLEQPQFILYKICGFQSSKDSHCDIPDYNTTQYTENVMG